jgi:hypothetical protein
MSSKVTAVDESASGTAWSPLRIPVFRTIWTASVVSNTGTWLSMVGTTWPMTLIAPSPLMVSLVQAASTLPVFVFAERWLTSSTSAVC